MLPCLCIIWVEAMPRVQEPNHPSPVRYFGMEQTKCNVEKSQEFNSIAKVNALVLLLCYKTLETASYFTSMVNNFNRIFPSNEIQICDSFDVFKFIQWWSHHDCENWGNYLIHFEMTWLNVEHCSLEALDWEQSDGNLTCVLFAITAENISSGLNVEYEIVQKVLHKNPWQNVHCTPYSWLNRVYVFTLTHLPLDKMAAISANDIFKCIFLNEKDKIPITISLNLIPRGPIDNTQALVQVKAWRRTGDKPLPEPMMA